MPRAIDVAAQVPHARGARLRDGRARRRRPSGRRADEIDGDGRLVREAIAAGALGFSTSRTLLHRAIDGEPMPGLIAGEDELIGIGRALGEAGHGVFEMSRT